MKLFPYFIKRKIKAMLAQPRETRSVSINEARKVLILAEAADVVAISDYITSQSPLKDKTTICAQGANVPEGVEKVDAKLETNSSWIPNEALVKRFDTIEADIIIDLSAPNDYVMKYLMVNSGVGLRVGVTVEEWNLYDLSVSMTESTETIEKLKQILFYLKSVRSKG
jgi:hypothetical protein